jgi:hypothetical protein
VLHARGRGWMLRATAMLRVYRDRLPRWNDATVS